MRLLALSTSTRRGSAAVVTPDAVHLVAYDDPGHAERIVGAIDAALAASGLARADLDAVACDMGPGSFTGVRVGVSVAKGIALALGVPLVGVASLEAMAAAAFDGGGERPTEMCAALVDAKKGEVFFGVYRAALPYLEPVVPPAHAALADAAALLPPGAAVVGEIAEALGLARAITGPAVDLPSADAIGRLAARRLAGIEAGDPRFDPAALEPLYVRAPDVAQPREAPTAKLASGPSGGDHGAA